jgi:hypothetical protein
LEDHHQLRLLVLVLSVNSLSELQPTGKTLVHAVAEAVFPVHPEEAIRDAILLHFRRLSVLRR